MSTANPPQVVPRTSVPRWWLLAGRVASPVSACLLLVGRLLPGGGVLKGASRDVLLGRRSLVGPAQAVTTSSGATIPAGVFSEAALSQRMNLELESAELDAAYLKKMGPRKDLGILLRGLWTLALDRGETEAREPGDHFNLFGVIVNNSDTPRILETIRSLAVSHPNMLVQMLPDSPAEPAPPVHVCFVNANNFNLALERREYMEVLRQGDLVLPDGIGVKLGLQMAGGVLRKNLNGTDLMPHLAELFAREGWPLFLLGATNEVLDTAGRNLRKMQPNLQIAGSHDGYFRKEDEEALCEEINRSGAMVLVVGMGTPRQEMWVARNLRRLRVPIVLSMGGLLDFLGEKNRRAPMWMRQAGLEWVFRLLQEPGRMWRRYIIGNPVFLWRVRKWIRQSQAQATRRRKR